MKSAYLYKSSLIIKIALATAILLIVYITGVFFDQMQNLGRSVDEMSLANRRLVELEQVMGTISRNESAVRSFMITRDSVYLQNRFTPKRTLKRHFDELSRIANAKDSFDPEKLREMVDRRFDQFGLTLYKARSHPPGDAELARTILQADELSDSIRSYD